MDAVAYDEFQATDDGSKVLLGYFDSFSGQAHWVKEIRPRRALQLARELVEAAALADPTIIEVKEYLAMAVKPPDRINYNKSPCRYCGAPGGRPHMGCCNSGVES